MYNKAKSFYQYNRRLIKKKQHGKPTFSRASIGNRREEIPHRSRTFSDKPRRGEDMWGCVSVEKNS
jgi:hypothetical protein